MKEVGRLLCRLQLTGAVPPFLGAIKCVFGGGRRFFPLFFLATINRVHVSQILYSANTSPAGRTREEATRKALIHTSYAQL